MIPSRYTSLLYVHNAAFGNICLIITKYNKLLFSGIKNEGIPLYQRLLNNNNDGNINRKKCATEIKKINKNETGSSRYIFKMTLACLIKRFLEEHVRVNKQLGL